VSTPLHSPALAHRSGAYPLRFEDRVPKSIRMNETVWPDEFLRDDPSWLNVYAFHGWTYQAHVSSNGDVCAIVSGKLVALRPHQFSIVEWHP
jgi:hypothetical protein